MMRKRMALGALGVALIGAGTAGGVAVAGDEGADGPASTSYTQEQADSAKQAALDATGGGTANSVERDNEDGATWEVEVTKDNGETVDVRLDASYDLVVIDNDDEGPDSDD